MASLFDFVLLSPAGLLGLAALAIPVLIHLFSRSRGRRVLIGHIDLVKKARRQRVTEVRLTQWILLALRLALLVLAALILAQLARQGLADRDGDVAYVSRGWFLAAGPDALEPLLEAHPGGVFRLAPGFPPVAELPDPASPLPAAQLDNIWPFLAERLSTERHTGAVTVYATGLALELGSRIPELPSAVSWQLLDSVPTAMPSDPLHVLIWHDAQRAVDADTVGLALDGIARHRLPGLTWDRRSAEDAGPDSDGVDRIIWLSSRNPPEDMRVAAVSFPEVPRSAGFPDQLFRQLMGPDRSRQAFSDARVPAARLTQTAQATLPAGQWPNRPMQTWLAGLMLLLWAAERWLSERRPRNDG